MQFSTFLLFTILSLAAATPAPTPATLQKRWCPRAELPAATTLCEEWFGSGNNQARKCERLLEELAAQNCECPGPEQVLYDAEAERIYCEPTGPCWY